MATKITNQATLSYASGSNTLSTSSNTASVTLQGPLEVEKYSLETDYKLGQTITYNVFVTNTSANALSMIKIVDNLGTYSISPSQKVTPLTYLGPAKIFVNHAYVDTVNGVVSLPGDSVTFTIATLASGSTLHLEYKVEVNDLAGATLNTSKIENTVSVTATGYETPVTATNPLYIGSYADIVIDKSMAPDPVPNGGTLTYTFLLHNYGTIDATKVVLRDSFDPQPTISDVIVDNTKIADDAYSYETGIFQYPKVALTSTYTVPKATFTQDPTTGVVTIVPGESKIVIVGKL